MTEATPDYHVSSREQRIRDAIRDIPEFWETVRPRGDSERISRHLTTLRFRLDKLVSLEHRYGDDQKNLSRNRAERNALIWALHALTPLAHGADTPSMPQSTKTGRKPHDPAYVAELFARIGELDSAGFTIAHADKPGVLNNQRGETIAPVEVPLSIWFYFRAQGGSSAR